jgi:hypothetical protein
VLIRPLTGLLFNELALVCFLKEWYIASIIMLVIGLAIWGLAEVGGAIMEDICD